MFLKKSINAYRSVHPQIRTLYHTRIVYNLLAIPPFFSIFVDLGKSSLYFIAVLINSLIWPHFAFYIAATSKNPRRTETLFNHAFEFSILSFWLPILQFNPYMIMLAAVGIVFVGFADKKTFFQIVMFRLIGFAVAILLSTSIFGFHFQMNIGLRSTILSASYVILFIYTSLAAAYSSAQKITVTRKEFKSALFERNQAYQKLNNELKVAESYVRNMLPSPICDARIKANWLFQPSALLGGDAFGYYWLDSKHFAFYLLDVSGHGVGAALLSVSILNDLRSKTLRNADFKHPHQVLGVLNNTFPSDKHDDMFFTIWYGVFNIQNRTLKFASAGHPPAILICGTESSKPETMLLKTPNIVIGGFSDTSFNESSLELLNNTTLYLFSDGVYEVARPDGAMWKYDEFQEYLLGIGSKHGSRLDQLFKHVKSMSGSESLADDFSIIEIVFK